MFRKPYLIAVGLSFILGGSLDGCKSYRFKRNGIWDF